MVSAYDFILVCDGDGNKHIYAVTDSGEDIFLKAAQVLCMDDCTGYTIMAIVHNGQYWYYTGWEPMLKYTFEDKTGEHTETRYLDPDRWDH